MTWLWRAVIPKSKTKSNNLITLILFCSSLRLFMLDTSSPYRVRTRYDPIFVQSMNRKGCEHAEQQKIAWHAPRIISNLFLKFTCSTSSTNLLKNKMFGDKPKICVAHFLGPISTPENACILARPHQNDSSVESNELSGIGNLDHTEKNQRKQ